MTSLSRHGSKIVSDHLKTSAVAQHRLWTMDNGPQTEQVTYRDLGSRQAKIGIE